MEWNLVVINTIYHIAQQLYNRDRITLTKYINSNMYKDALSKHVHV